ncbi:tripeptidyl-peptidase I [Sporothrix brasiliensis 5110]|uniref:tripeptidyl-peptidase II n=1 Tax=Sporothrix brasiliensis 5110 TaxID=1398154 RepID=A0A0C2EWK1_9PEZI|nr:tripeptidyl-peptidase I [Sporothrix brasiliensis 5110]KIH90964.1 tripeptidyl-peptidase I [Sporothrix brasiliensis 5110]
MLAPFLFLASVASAKVFHSLPNVPQGWSLVRNASPSDAISLKIALRQRSADDLERVVLEVSTPGHPNYGMHLTRDEVRSYTAPSDAAVDNVSIWLRDNGIEPSVNNDWVSFTTTVDRADALLDTRFDWYQYEDSNTPVLRTLAYSVPDALTNHLDMVQPTTRFGKFSTHKSTVFSMQYLEDNEDSSAKSALAVAAQQNDVASCGNGVTPQCLKTLYNINYTVTDPAQNLIGFASYLNEYARYSDLALFTKYYVPAAKGQNFSVALINDGKNDQSSAFDSGEANLDVQNIIGISHPIPIIEYSTGGLGPLVPTPDEPTQPGSNEPYLEFLTYMLALNDSSLPQTLSTSYGEEEQSVPPEYAYKVCNLFMQLGARGVSVLFSSGDSGPGDACVRVSDNKPYFQPSFPAGCPYVTAVGATHQTGPELAVSFSSGGFSSLHPRPPYQDTAVSTYLQSIGDTYAPFFNASNRGFPDVAAQGNNFLIFDKGRSAQLAGTSASAPVVAGVVALLNAARRSKGLSPLGFLNPWLYNNTAAWNDITGGAGIGCTNTTYFDSPASWNATKGWDPVTGLGTPNFPALLQVAAPGVPNQ